MSSCKGECCLGGADVDIGERDRILENADLVQTVMDSNQEHTPENWFEDLIEDSDFPSGKAVTTQMHNDQCVFLNSAKRCVLQLAEEKMPSGSQLKPFFCRAYPVCLQNGVLTVDHQFEDQTACCGLVAKGALTIFDVCEIELEHVLGTDGAAELRGLAGRSVDVKSKIVR